MKSNPKNFYWFVFFMVMVAMGMTGQAFCDSPHTAGAEDAGQIPSPMSDIFQRHPDLRDSHKERKDYALVNGEKIQYWLYYDQDINDYGKDVTINDLQGSSSIYCLRYDWIHKLGYVFDRDNSLEPYKNPNLAESVKKLMQKHGCNVSIALITSESHNTDRDYVVVNLYNHIENTYYTALWYMHKASSQEEAHRGILYNRPEDFQYDLSSDKSSNGVVITGFSEKPVGRFSIDIPETIEGFPVTEIGAGAFALCSGLVEAKLPDSIQRIGSTGMGGHSYSV